jgi:hypothetical protein
VDTWEIRAIEEEGEGVVTTVFGTEAEAVQVAEGVVAEGWRGVSIVGTFTTLALEGAQWAEVAR